VRVTLQARPPHACRSNWVTIRNTRNIHIRSSRVPSAEVYFSVSETLHTSQADEIESSSTEIILAPCGLEAGGVAVLPGPGNLEGWPGFERNSGSVLIPDARFEDNINGPRQRTGS